MRLTAVATCAFLIRAVVLVNRLERLTLDPKANSLLQKGGLKVIDERLDEAEDRR